MFRVVLIFYTKKVMVDDTLKIIQRIFLVNCNLNNGILVLSESLG